jgi:hypothetical protein
MAEYKNWLPKKRVRVLVMARERTGGGGSNGLPCAADGKLSIEETSLSASDPAAGFISFLHCAPKRAAREKGARQETA